MYTLNKNYNYLRVSEKIEAREWVHAFNTYFLYIFRKKFSNEFR